MIPEDFKRLLGPVHLAAEIEDPAQYWIWVFNPDTGSVRLEHNEDRHPAHHLDHSDLAKLVPNPDRVHGYAYRLRHGKGFRITDWDHHEVKDPYIKRQVDLALQGRQVEASISQVQLRVLR